MGIYMSYICLALFNEFEWGHPPLANPGRFQAPLAKTCNSTGRRKRCWSNEHLLGWFILVLYLLIYIYIYTHCTHTVYIYSIYYVVIVCVYICVSIRRCPRPTSMFGSSNLVRDSLKPTFLLIISRHFVC